MPAGPGLGRRSAYLTFPNTALAGFRWCQSPIANCVGKFCSGCWNAGPDRRVLCITEHQEEKMTDKLIIRGGEILARSLKEKGVEDVFTLAGGFCNPALEGFMKCQMSVINCPHEQVAGHLADGHTRISRQPSVCLVGPEGFANAVPAMLEALGVTKIEKLYCDPTGHFPHNPEPLPEHLTDLSDKIKFYSKNDLLRRKFNI